MNQQPSDESRASIGVTLDIEREQRCGFAEVVYSPGKTPETLLNIVSQLRASGQPVLATRLDAPQVEALKARFKQGIINDVARTFRWPVDPINETPTSEIPIAPVCVVSAGTGDLPIAHEAIETLHWMNVPVRQMFDVGVAGPHRLQERVGEFEGCAAVVVVAGMEGALPSVVGGHVSCPVIGVPTSVGYGANLGGWSALLSMLNSCAANVTVVNIDAGFKGGYMAGLIATQARRNLATKVREQMATGTQVTEDAHQQG